LAEAINPVGGVSWRAESFAEGTVGMKKREAPHGSSD